MRQLIKSIIRRLLGAGGYTVIGPEALNDIRREILETKSGVSQLQAEAGETRSHVLAMHDTLIKHLEEERLLSTVDGALHVDRHVIDLPWRLDAAGGKCLAAINGVDGQSVLNRGVAAHFAKSARLVAHHWPAQDEAVPDPFADDDRTIDYVKRVNIFVPGNEVEVKADRPSVPWRHLFDDPETGVFLVMGQSNAANHGEGTYTPRHEVYCYDFMRLRCYEASDPLPGASGNNGSPWPRLGDRLIEKGLFRRVLFVPIAFGGTYVTDWIPGGDMNRRAVLALSRLRKEMGVQLLGFSGVIWQQGEAEANHTQMTSRAYKMHFQDIVADLRVNGVFAPVYIAQTTRCEAGDHPYENHASIRAAQAELADPTGGILAGPDLDTIGVEGRLDECHFSIRGLEQCAELWCDAIAETRSVLVKA